jgi:cytochrome c oxidase subunit 2
MSEYGFRWVLMLLCLLVFATAFSALIWFAWRHHRARASDESEQSNFHSTLAVEIAWTLVPCAVVLLLVWPTARIFWTP